MLSKKFSGLTKRICGNDICMYDRMILVMIPNAAAANMQVLKASDTCAVYCL